MFDFRNISFFYGRYFYSFKNFLANYSQNMNTFFQILVGVGLLLIPVALPAQSVDDSWLLEEERDGIRVYLRTNTDKLKEVRLIANFRIGIAEILEVLDDVEEYPNWVYRTMESEIIERKRDTSFLYRPTGSDEIIVTDTLYYYTRTDFPWPLSDRDFVIRSWTEPADTHGVVRSLSRGVDRPEFRPGEAQRVTLFQSDWTLIPQADGSTTIDYYLRTDPAGSIPTWITNLAIKRGPVKLVEAFRRKMTGRPLNPVTD